MSPSAPSVFRSATVEWLDEARRVVVASRSVMVVLGVGMAFVICIDSANASALTVASLYSMAMNVRRSGGFSQRSFYRRPSLREGAFFSLKRNEIYMVRESACSTELLLVVQIGFLVLVNNNRVGHEKPVHPHRTGSPCSTSSHSSTHSWYRCTSPMRYRSRTPPARSHQSFPRRTTSRRAPHSLGGQGQGWGSLCASSLRYP